MKHMFINIRLILFCSFCCITLFSGAKQINPLTQAMLDGYETLLQQDPNDYLTLYERASQYYRLDDYDKALSDIKKAIDYTPAKEKEQLMSEYALLADIYIQTQSYSDALAAINKALDMSPSSYRMLYTRGNICLYLNQPGDARGAYNAMLSLNPRSPEALFGLARVSIMEGKKDDALKYMSEAEKMDQSNYLTYCRLGDLHRDLGMPRNAAADYLNAFSLTTSSDRPMTSIMALAKSNFDDVNEAIDYALQKTANVIPLYFILGNAAKAAGQYNDAYNAYRQLTASLSDSEAKELYAEFAEICLMSDRLAEADDYANKALMHKSDARSTSLKASLENIHCNYHIAQSYINQALSELPDDYATLMKAAEIAYNLKDYPTAVKHLNHAIINKADAADALMFRAYILSNHMNERESGQSDYSRVISLPVTTPNDMTIKAIAQLKSGHTMDAESTIASVKAAARTDAESAYLSTLYSIAEDNMSAATEMLKQAVALGFDDAYLLKYNALPLLSIAPIR